MSKTKSLEAALPWLYLKGISTGEMHAAFTSAGGPGGSRPVGKHGIPPEQVWAEEYRDWRTEGLDKEQWVYVWADGVYSGLRAEHAKLCALVISV